MYAGALALVPLQEFRRGLWVRRREESQRSRERTVPSPSSKLFQLQTHLVERQAHPASPVQSSLLVAALLVPFGLAASPDLGPDSLTPCQTTRIRKPRSTAFVWQSQ